MYAQGNYIDETHCVTGIVTNFNFPDYLCLKHDIYEDKQTNNMNLASW